MASWLTRCLHLFSPETAHAIAIYLFLRLNQFFIAKVLRRTSSGSPNIFVEGVGFRNRLGLAAGFDKNAEAFLALSRFGFGFIEVGTVTPLPQSGNPEPRLFREKDNNLVNRMGFNNCGLECFSKNIQKYRHRTSVPLFANLGKGKRTELTEALEDYKKGFYLLSPLVDGFVINISSPNTPALRDLQNETFLTSLSQAVPLKKPVWVKLAPDLDPETLRSILETIKKLDPITGVVLTNTSRSLAEGGYPEGGGWSGPRLLERSLEFVAMARQIFGVSKTIVGVGGVSSIDDYRKMRAAGADLVEIYTALIYQGPKLVKEITRSISGPND